MLSVASSAVGIAQIAGRHVGAGVITLDPFDSATESFWRERVGSRASLARRRDSNGEDRPRLWLPCKTPSSLPHTLMAALTSFLSFPTTLSTGFMSPFTVGAINAYRVECDAEITRRAFFKSSPSRLTGIYAFDFPAARRMLRELLGSGPLTGC